VVTIRSQEPAPAPPPPERDEPTRRPAGVRSLTARDARAIVVRSVRGTLADHATDRAAAVAYYGFLAIPAILLLTLGVFGLVATPQDVASLMDRLGQVMPQEAVTLLQDSLTRIVERQGSGLTLLGVGLVLGLWTASGAMNALMRALNGVYGREETRGFVRQRLVALGLLAWTGLAALLVLGMLVLGAPLAGWIGDATGAEGLVATLWWTLQWPILIIGLLVAFAGVLYLGPDVAHPRWRLLSIGALVTVVIWIAASGLFSLYVGMFGSYDATWGSLAAVVILLVWLWLSALALLIGAEVNAEVERSRELREGQPAEERIQAPHRGSGRPPSAPQAVGRPSDQRSNRTRSGA
jgi:membrane protein